MIYVLLGVLGLALGSFVNAVVWRLHEAEKTKSKAKKRELSIMQGRSMCPRCKHTLGVLDLIPVFSWPFLRGRCRYCKKPISMQYPLVEVVFAAALVTSWYAWPLSHHSVAGYIAFAVWAAALTLLAALFIYDLKWMMLPNKLVYSLIGVTLVFKICEYIANQPDAGQFLISAVGGMLIIGGFFWVMYQISKGKWIGGGDVRLGFGLGLLLGWQKSLVCLTGAAYAATLVIVILALLGKYHKKMKLPFGPFLIAATYASLLWGQYVIDFYKRLSGL